MDDKKLKEYLKGMPKGNLECLAFEIVSMFSVDGERGREWYAREYWGHKQMVIGFVETVMAMIGDDHNGLSYSCDCAWAKGCRLKDRSCQGDNCEYYIQTEG